MNSLITLGGVVDPGGCRDGRAPFNDYGCRLRSMARVLRPDRRGLYSSAPSDSFLRRGGGGIAQLGEHRLCKPKVTGSIPVASTAGTISALETDHPHEEAGPV